MFHLAAQPLVRDGYRDPLGRSPTNVMGTAHVLEAVRDARPVRAVVVVTTDKVYENRETGTRSARSDPLGGHDPYSASKAAAEIVVGELPASFFGDRTAIRRGSPPRGPATSSAAATGPTDRLVPDCLRAFAAGEPVRLRRPDAVRPWQHVLEPLSGYLRWRSGCSATAARRSPGPGTSARTTAMTRPSREVAHASRRCGATGARVATAASRRGERRTCCGSTAPRARTELGWRPRWSLEQALEQTVAWHQAWRRGEDMHAVTTRADRRVRARSRVR